MSSEERIASLEAKLDRNERDIVALFEFIRKHMEKEDKHNETLMAHISKIEGRMDKQKNFVGGIVFTVSSLWFVVAAIGAWFFKFKT